MSTISLNALLVKVRDGTGACGAAHFWSQLRHITAASAKQYTAGCPFWHTSQV
jgi:hypothetical protein